MKILWLSNCALASTLCKGSGSWLFGMKDIISPYVELYNITEGNTTDILKNREGEFTEYIIPTFELIDNLPSITDVRKILDLIDEIKPDIIQVWGMEKYWAQIFVNYKTNYRVLLEIQGLMSACANVFWGGLTNSELNYNISIKDILKPSTNMIHMYELYKYKGSLESTILREFSLISTQSDWTRNQISLFCKDDSKIFNTICPLRNEFYKSLKWSTSPKTAPIIFTSISYCIPFKGLHVLLKALSLVVSKYKDAKLLVAGLTNDKPFYKCGCYDLYIKKIIKDNNLENNIEFLGNLNASEIIGQLLNCDVYANPSFVESYSTATAEALFLGVPSVLSYAGALPNFNDPNRPLAEYYAPLDFVDCAYKILKLFEDKEHSCNLSNNAIYITNKSVGNDRIREVQMSIYETILKT